MAGLGFACLLLALALCLYGIGASIYGVRSGRVEFSDSGSRAVYTLAGLLTVAFAVLELAFLRNDFTFNTVADTSSRTTPEGYRAAAVWSSQEGSLLLWAWLLSMWASLALFLTRKRMRDIAGYATAILLGFAGFFVSLMIFYANPFKTTTPAPAEGVGPGPAAALPDDDDPPADAVLRLHALHDPARVRDGSAARPAGGRRMDQVDPAVRVRGLARSSGSGSCSEPAGPTRSSGGAATGAGTRSRTPR